MAVVLNQEHFRIRTDATAAQGGTPVWAAAQDTNVSLAATDTFRIRFVVANTGSTSSTTIARSIEVSRNSGTFSLVTASSSFVQAVDATSGASANNSTITTQLLTGVGTFSGTGVYNDTGSTATLTIPAGDCVELEFGMQFVAPSAGDTYDFHVFSGGSALNTYTVTPRVTISAISGIAYVGNGGYNAASASGGTASVTLTFPSGIATGNLVIASVVGQDSTTTTPTVTTPTGWSLLGSVLSNSFSGGTNKLFLYGAFWASGLTGTFSGASLGTGGIDGDILGLSGTASTIGTAFGNFTSVAPNVSTTTAIPGPSGFTTGQWNYWCAVDYDNLAAPATSPTLSNFYYNTGVFEGFAVGTTEPGSAPGTETFTWSVAGNFVGAGITVLPPSGNIDVDGISLIRVRQGWRFTA